MSDLKVYNVIFPIWFLLFFPPVIFLTLLGNFIIDWAVLIACFYAYKLSTKDFQLKGFYKKTIVKVWLFGFLADMIGAAILFFFGTVGEGFGVPYELTAAISYDPFSHPLAVIIILFSMVVASICIFLFNYHFSFKNMIEDKSLRFKIALTIAIITIPWTFLLPTKWFYY